MIRRQHLEQQLGVTADNGEQIVEFVCNPARKPRDGVIVSRVLWLGRDGAEDNGAHDIEIGARPAGLS